MFTLNSPFIFSVFHVFCRDLKTLTKPVGPCSVQYHAVENRTVGFKKRNVSAQNCS